MAARKNSPATPVVEIDETRPASEQGDGDPTPVQPAEGDKGGLHDGAPRRKIVGDYPERPYGDAITPEHLAVLRVAGQEPV